MYYFTGKEQFSIEEFEDKVEINPFKGIYESPMRRLDYQHLDVEGSPNDPDWKRKDFHCEPLDPNKDYEFFISDCGYKNCYRLHFKNGIYYYDADYDDADQD